MSRARVGIWLCLGVTLAAWGMGCGASPKLMQVSREDRAAAQMGAKSAPPAAPLTAPALGGTESAAAPLAFGAVAASQPDRQLIKNATVNVEVANARAAADQLMTTVQAVGGYVGEMRESVDGLGRRSINIQVRVPADKFDASMQNLDSLGTVINKQITTEDVTEEFVDTEARARNLKKMEERLLDHLNRFGELKDVLGVEKELTRVREDIEKLDGRLRFLSHRVAYSTMLITFAEKPKAEPLTPARSFSTAKVATEAVRSLVEFGLGVWYYAIWLTVWSPVWGAIAVLVWLVRRLKPRQTNPVEPD